MEEKKKFFYKKQIKFTRDISKNWSELAIKNIWKKVKLDKELCQYLPDEEMNLNRHHDRDFFWGILFTLR